MQPITNQEKIFFWLRVYLGTTNIQELKLAAVDRAYRDFNRTMHGFREERTPEAYNILRNLMLIIAEETFTTIFDQASFDVWHKSKCDQLIAEFYNLLKYQISYGQAQKWINMTLKYMFAIGNEIINGIDKNYMFFHIPVDNIIQDKLEFYDISKIKGKWSRIDNYEIYFQYQKLVREAFIGQIPLEVEFRLFNE
ncbi:hypothetical protein OX284_016920 [Flavobacterium sp. SUN046]|uniref:hypothetical protein n=1 Tax=Flavobacterium sp. SUN046 TaxID=3002440 RepID=UPI002DBC77BC|nr:hypothetical protein [Flavobacterium sp. SUN046]MEC4051120.1 hypothetical protein [Flavobacterium sp. SUN046]